MRYSAIEFQKDRKFGDRIEEVMMERRFSLRGGVLEIFSTSCTLKIRKLLAKGDRKDGEITSKPLGSALARLASSER